MKTAQAKLKAYLALPERLRDLIEQSLFFMRAHPEHMLNFGYRYAIYAAIGAEYPSRPRVDTLGHKRRAYLNILTAEHALPTWNACLTRYPTWSIFQGYPQDLLQAARDILFEGIEFASHKWLDLKRSPHLKPPPEHPRFQPPQNETERWFQTFSLHDMDHDPVLDQQDITVLMCGGIGAVKGLQVTLIDAEYEYEKTDFSITESITDFYGWDCAYDVMNVVSDWSPEGGNKIKRKAFWEWWLLSAVPDAYNQFPH